MCKYCRSVNNKKELIEKLIDEFSVSELLTLMSEISSEKAEHIQTNWQDEPLANWWSDVSSQLEILAEKCM